MYAISLHDALHTNKFTILFIGLSLMGRVTNPLTCSGSGRVSKILGRVGSQKSDPCPTLSTICMPTASPHSTDMHLRTVSVRKDFRIIGHSWVVAE